MTDYLLLYGGGKMPESEEEQAAVMQAWTDWFNKLGGTLKDGGNPFTPAAKSISNDGSVKDGPGTGMATGYSIVTADSSTRPSRRPRAVPSWPAARTSPSTRRSR